MSFSILFLNFKVILFSNVTSDFQNVTSDLWNVMFDYLMLWPISHIFHVTSNNQT